jgi:hypothetical protein
MRAVGQNGAAIYDTVPSSLPVDLNEDAIAVSTPKIAKQPTRLERLDGTPALQQTEDVSQSAHSA